MRLSELQYDLPPELIAQQPAEPRDASRLLVLDGASGRIAHRIFRDIGEYLAPGDCLVLNDTRVIRARFYCRRASGGRVEGLFLHQDGNAWRVLLKPAARLKRGERLTSAGSDVGLIVEERLERGECLVRPDPAVAPLDWLARFGHTPLPPYIRRATGVSAISAVADAERYQTVYAERPGAVAAPTAGLHFTEDLFGRLAAHGVRCARVTLHVGAGTFVPIQTEDLAAHRMHAEWYEVTPAAVQMLRTTRAAGGRIVAVGTTSVRVLESLPEGTMDGGVPGDPPLWRTDGDASAPVNGWTDIFIYPPYRFRHVDRLITNFHLPGSTLLALVMALATPERIKSAYWGAIEQRYRFYSYGDAMLIM